MPTDIAWRPGREKVRLYKRLNDRSHKEWGIVIEVRFNQRARNERARITSYRKRRITIRALAVGTIRIGGRLVVLMLPVLTHINRHHRR